MELVLSDFENFHFLPFFRPIRLLDLILDHILLILEIMSHLFLGAPMTDQFINVDGGVDNIPCGPTIK
jgi:hypothetical protein